MTPRQQFWFVWGAPIYLGLLAVFGLLAALLGTGRGTGLPGSR